MERDDYGFFLSEDRLEELCTYGYVYLVWAQIQ